MIGGRKEGRSVTSKLGSVLLGASARDGPVVRWPVLDSLDRIREPTADAHRLLSLAEAVVGELDLALALAANAANLLNDCCCPRSEHLEQASLGGGGPHLLKANLTLADGEILRLTRKGEDGVAGHPWEDGTIQRRCRQFNLASAALNDNKGVEGSAFADDALACPSFWESVEHLLCIEGVPGPHLDGNGRGIVSSHFVRPKAARPRADVHLIEEELHLPAKVFAGRRRHAVNRGAARRSDAKRPSRRARHRAQIQRVTLRRRDPVLLDRNILLQAREQFLRVERWQTNRRARALKASHVQIRTEEHGCAARRPVHLHPLKA
mmetsp:Transcript_8018/g.26667  ORF Transcript_8018/g.26667 Transcript_8018/m.26667 type:complete len:322 (-) Transcript_8018:263-1228(-)